MNNDFTRRVVLRIVIILLITVVALGTIYYIKYTKSLSINSFEECAQAGYPVMETYPERCRAGSRLFVRDIE